LPEEALSWTQLSVQQRTILAPLEAEWNRLPAYQQRRLVGVANAYPTSIGRISSAFPHVCCNGPVSALSSAISRAPNLENGRHCRPVSARRLSSGGTNGWLRRRNTMGLVPRAPAARDP